MFEQLNRRPRFGKPAPGKPQASNGKASGFCPRPWVLAAAAAVWLLLPDPSAAGDQSLAVVPILIGPLQVLLAILPAILIAIGGAILSMFKPSAIKAAARLLWKKKIPTVIFVAVVVGACYLVSYAFPSDAGQVTRASGGVDWPAFRGGNDRRASTGEGDDPAERAVIHTFTDEIVGMLRNTKVKTFHASPAVVGNRVYVSSAVKQVFTDRGAIYCLDADTLGIAWKYSPKDFRATYSSPAVAGKYLVCGEGLHFTRDARITCLDVSDGGKRLWELRTSSHVESSPCIYDGKAYIGAGDDGMYCIALAPVGGEPKVIWHLEGQSYPDCEASPIVHEETDEATGKTRGLVFFGLGEGGHAVVCVEAQTGKEVWRTEAPYPVFGSPTIADGKLLVGMGNGNLIETAEVVRQNKILKMRKQGLSESDIAAATKDLGPAGEVWCLNPRDGNVLWKFKLPRTVLGTLAADDGRLYFGCRDGKLYCLTTDGELVGRPFDAHEPVVTSPAVGREHVYFVTVGGRLYCLDRRTLRRVWDMPVGTAGPFLSSPVVARGHVYVGTAEDGFMCVGRPADTSRVPVWAGRLGGSGQSGWMDGSPVSDNAKLAWRYPRLSGGGEAAVHAPAACLEQAVYAGVDAGGKVGLVKLSGASERSAARTRGPQEEWFYPTPNPLHASVAVRARRVFFVDGKPGDPDRNLHCVNAQDGKAVWKRPVADDANGEVLIAAARLFAFDDAGRLACIALSEDPEEDTYQVLWRQGLSRPVGPPAVVKGLVLVATGSPPGVVALDVADGSRKWQTDLPATPTTGAISRHDLVAVGTEGGLAILSVFNGALLPPLLDCGAVRGPLTADETHLACATAAGEGMVYRWTGRAVARLKDVQPGIPPMLLGDRALCVIGGNLESVDLSTGQRRRWCRTAWLGPITAPPVVGDSHLYFGTGTKGLACVGPRK